MALYLVRNPLVAVAQHVLTRYGPSCGAVDALPARFSASRCSISAPTASAVSRAALLDARTHPNSRGSSRPLPAPPIAPYAAR